MSHHVPAAEAIEDKHYGLSSFANDAALATFDLDNDEKVQKQSQVMRWDKKKGKYINSRSADDTKYIISESGQRIPATLRSGKFDEWRKKRNIQSAQAGMAENVTENKQNKRFKHNKVAAPKLPDKFRDDYHKQKKKVGKAVDAGVNVKGFNKPGQREELRLTDQIRKMRNLKEKRRAKNARPSSKGKRR